MGSLRCALFNPTWSILAQERSDRPQPFESGAERATPVCPFCEGNEHETASEVFAIRRAETRPDEPGWTVRVVSNKFPALGWRLPNTLTTGSAHHQVIDAVGVHEVVIDSPEHDRQIGQFLLRHCQTVLDVYRSRLLALTNSPDIRSVALFRNVGRAAGASQEHPHTQILALPIVPARLQHEIDATHRYFCAHGRCITCDMLRHDLAEIGRLVARNDHFAAVTSFSPRFPYETRIVPSSHSDDFRELSRGQIPALAVILKQVLSALETALGSFPFNLVLQTAPLLTSRAVEQAFHWRIEILPRLTIPSGLELGHSVFIVSVTPENAARTLRAAIETAIHACEGRSIEDPLIARAPLASSPPLSESHI